MYLQAKQQSFQMVKLFLVLYTVLFCSMFSFGQDEQLQKYKQLIQLADSLNQSGHHFTVSARAYDSAQKSDGQHPAAYLEAASAYIKEGGYDDAAFLYYLGMMRYSYYNSSNPNYKASNDGALASSLQYVLGGVLNIYLAANVENFIQALKNTVDYYSKNDYLFYPKKRDSAKYNQPVEALNKLIKDLTINSSKYKKVWEEQRKSMLDMIEKDTDAYNKLTPEEKAKLNSKD